MLSFSFPLTILFLLSIVRPPRGHQKTPETLHTLRRQNPMVREVGFEPTNPYGTGASGLRVQDPFSHDRVSLTWLGNTSRRKQRTPAHQPEPLPQTANPVQAVNWLSPPRHTRSKNRKMFNSSPTH